MCVCLVGCGNNNSNNQEQGTNDSCKTNTNDVVKVTDSAKQVADKFNLNYDNVTVNYYFIDGYTDPSGGTIRVHLKDARIHWILEISNIVCQTSVAAGTLLLFKNI